MTDNAGVIQRFSQAARPPVIVVSLVAMGGLTTLFLLSAPPDVGTGHSGHGVPAAGLTAARIAVFLVTWTAMSAAMMLPSALSLLLAIERAAQGRSRAAMLPVLAGLAYLLVWAIVGVAILLIGEAARLYVHPLLGAQARNWVNGSCLVAAGLFGLSDFASSCLRACRRPFGFLARHWRGGDDVAFQVTRIGLAYGLSCVGCCVPMLAMMFVIGMANIALVVAMAALMAVIKSSIWGVQVARALSFAAMGAGLATGLGWLQLADHFH